MTGWDHILSDWPGEMMFSQNIAPTQTIPVVINQGDQPVSRSMRWGLVPTWSKTARPKFATFNARAETVKQKPSFRHAYAKAQTCLIPASGYYEWTGNKGHKIKHYIHHQDDSPLIMAGLWAHWQQGDEAFDSCTVLTRAAVASLTKIHPRMPLILNQDSAKGWLLSVPQQLDKLLASLQQHEGEAFSISAENN